jgi:3',5'-nucleoside bisphosphate phosphatase
MAGFRQERITRPSNRLTPMTAPTFELQSHSIHSDGELPPAGVVDAASQAGVELLALTDHDSLEGVEEAAGAASRAGIRLVTGVEISVLDAAATDLHVCGYRIDPANEPLLEQLARSRGDRERRAQRMIEALMECGWAVDQSLLEARVASGGTVGRPHLAQAVVAHPDNRARLEHERLAEPSAFLVAYLIEGRPAYREREAPTVEEAVALIHDAGGLAVWAHPFWDVSEDADVLAHLDRFVALGLDGVEAFYVTHTRAQTEVLVQRCAALDLITTGSSDFHGPHHSRFNRFRGFQTYGLRPNLGPLIA